MTPPGLTIPSFGTPRIRGGQYCFNPPAARFNVPITIRKTELVVAGRSKAQMADGIRAAFDKKEFRRSSGRDVLHAVEAGTLERPGRELASSPDVLRSGHGQLRRGERGCRALRLSSETRTRWIGSRCSWCRWTSGRTVQSPRWTGTDL